MADRPRILTDGEPAPTANVSVKIGGVWDRVKDISKARNKVRRVRRDGTPKVSLGTIIAEALDNFLPDPRKDKDPPKPQLDTASTGDEKGRSCHLPREIIERLAWTRAHWGVKNEALITEALKQWLAKSAS